MRERLCYVFNITIYCFFVVFVFVILCIDDGCDCVVVFAVVFGVAVVAFTVLVAFCFCSCCS